MPPPGQGKKKKKGRAPKHQNTFAFKHNPKSKKTDKILASPNVGVCRRCHDKIEWRKKYRKYKPRTQPGKCNICFQKNVMAAYHTICTKCTGSEKAIAAMMEKHSSTVSTTSNNTPAGASTSESDQAGVTSENKETSTDQTNDEQEEMVEPAASSASDAQTPNNALSKNKRLRVCAVCTTEPALSKYSNCPPEDMDIIEQLQSLEDMVEDGIGEDGKKMSVREVRAMERKIEKLQVELKERRKKRTEADDEEGEEDRSGGDNDEHADGNDDDDESMEGDNNPVDDETGEVEEDDPFLLATGGKALVGEEYQKMLLAKAAAAQQK